MNTLKSAAFWQIIAAFFLLMLVAHVPAQAPAGKNDKPQAILIGSWTESSRAAIPSSHNTATRKPRARFVGAASSNVAESAFNLAPNSLEKELFDLINAERRRMNLQQLEWDAEMLYLAREHSASMARNKFFSHQGTDGGMVDERARAAGINDWQGIGENITSSLNADDPVAVAMKCWLNSAAHYRNLLSEDWSRSGIGVAVSPEGKYYFTQVFRD